LLALALLALGLLAAAQGHIRNVMALTVIPGRSARCWS
jgi:hypothetical protein